MNLQGMTSWGLGALALGTLLLAATPAAAKVNVFACESDWAALATEIGGDLVSSTSATTAFQDPHQIQARPSLIARLRNADLLICNGGELEIGWLPVLLLQSANGRIQPGTPGYVMVADLLTLQDIPALADRALGDVHPRGNPHVQTDPRHIARAAQVLAERLGILDPDHAERYLARYRDFSQRWEEAMQRWEAKAAPLRGVPVVAHHKAWTYLFSWLGMPEAGYLEPKPGVPPSSAHLNALLAHLKVNPARMVIRSPYDAPQASEFVADRLGIPMVLLPFSVGGTPEAKNLFDLFDDTIDRLLQGAQGKTIAAGLPERP
jgi:zinc/manganese transport system substrate-binding protein